MYISKFAFEILIKGMILRVSFVIQYFIQAVNIGELIQEYRVIIGKTCSIGFVCTYICIYLFRHVCTFHVTYKSSNYKAILVGKR